MTRRLQLLDPESRSSGRSMSAVVARIRDGLLRDNKVIPAVLGVLALLIFAWLVAGVLIGGPGDDEEQQASNQASLAQGDDSDSGSSETPAPGVENRDADSSYAGFDEPKDPFEFPEGLRSKSGENTNGSSKGGQQGGDEDDRNGGDRNGGGVNSRGGDGGGGGNGRVGDRGGSDNDEDDDEDFIEQRALNESDSQDTPGGSARQGGTSQAGAGQSGTGQAGGGGLFNSGGDLPSP